jgi:hypothetical protein
MTDSPDPGVVAAVDQVHATASRFVDEMLTTSLTELQQGVQMPELFIRLGGTLHSMKATQNMSDAQLLVLTATAVARLAGMHHAAEQLADEFSSDTSWLSQEDCAEMLRKLVDDHG